MKRSSKFKDLTGLVFDRLRVVYQLPDREYPSGSKRVMWMCECICGELRRVGTTQLTTGKTHSCGCLKKELTSERSYKHGMGKTSVYMIWASMKDRCHNPLNKRYKYYGARGISVQQSWRDNFLEFYAYVGDKPDGRFSLDRIDNNGNYEEGNVRWATDKEQRNNQRKVQGINRFKLVQFHKASGKYNAKFRHEGKNIALPVNADEEDQARLIYLKYKEYYGEFPKYIEEDLIYLGLISTTDAELCT